MKAFPHLRAGILSVLLFVGLLLPASAWTPGTGSPNAVQGFIVDSSDRTDILAFYNTIYPASEGYVQNLAWTGNVTTGVAGTTGAAFKDDVRRRINFYRALTGLPADIVFNDTKSAKCQEMALMISANKAISHYPESIWTYYTANGAEAAANSNLHCAGGTGASTSVGPTAVNNYMVDDGSNNTVVGHRRWLLYSLGQKMGTGDVPATGAYASGNAIWVIGNFKASAPKAFVAWPNSGFVPQDLVPARWSLSYPGADFGSASVTMTTQSGAAVPVTMISRSDTGIGDNTIVWEPSGLPAPGLQDVLYNVTVSNISGSGVPASYSYTVTAINPDVLGDSVTISGTALAPLTGQSYSFNSIDQADQYQLRVSTATSAAWTEGAENLATILDGTASDYPLSQSTVKRTGSLAFHLTFPSFEAGEQGFEVNRDIIPSATSQLVFHDLFRYAMTGSRLSAEVSDDNGSTWSEVWSRNGNGSTSSSGWDSSFNARSVSLAAYAGKSLRIRFMYRLSGTTFIGADTNCGVFLDDISVTNATQLVNTNVTNLSGSLSSFTLNSSTAGGPLVAGTSYYLRIRPNVGTKWFGDGPLKIVTAQTQTPLPNQQVAGTLTIDLSEIFPLEWLGGQVARVVTTSGTFDIELLSGDAPATVANFLSYVQEGAYTNALVHRSVPGFIIQTGGYTATLPPVSVVQKPPVVNEYKISNTRGTIAMAKLGGDPNSATNQWFVNLADNSANLDNQNGGFTVFARVLGSGMAVADAIAGIPVYNVGSPFDQIPLRDMASGQTEILQPNFVAISSVSLLANFPTASSALAALAFSGTSSNAAVVSATISGKTLTLTRKAGMNGESLITLRATHLNGSSLTRTFKADITEPVVSVASPANAAKLAAPSAVFAGTVVETGSKPLIEFSTDNGAHWLPATIPPTSVKNPYAWTANVTLVPGANTFQFRATDLANNVSSVVSRTITYTVPPPVVTSPAAGAKITAPSVGPDTVSFKGTVPDAGGMPDMEFSINAGASWTAASVTGAKAPYAWSANVTLSPSTNTMLFRTVDVLGQKGQPVSRSVTYLKPSTAALQIAAQGNGTFTNVTNGIYGKNLNLNMPYTVTATPKTGMIFKEWLKNGVSFSRNATLAFTMEEGLTLTPVFIVNPFPAVVGTFNGLVGNGTETDMNRFFLGNGFVTLTTTGTGTFSGSLRLEGQSLTLSGKFDGYGETTLLLKRTGKTAVAVALALDLTKPGEVTGTVTPAGGTALAFTSLPGIYTGVGKDIHPLCLARYTIALPAPDGTLGHGYATMVVDAKGLAKFAGKLADGTTFTTSARMVDDGANNWVVPVHIPLYKAFGGMLLGEVVVPKAEPAAAAGSLGWLRPANAKATMFPTGFLKTLAPQGERYQLTNGLSLLTGDATTGNFTLTFDPGLAALTTALTQNGTWPKTNAPLLTKPPTGLTFTFTPTTGVFKGTFNRTDAKGKPVSTAYEGVVLSNSKFALVRGAGFFTTGNASAAVEILTPSSDMAQIPAGSFQMGNALSASGDGQSDELPVHLVNVSAFSMEKYEVTKAQWDEVRAWGLNNGYTDLDVGDGPI